MAREPQISVVLPVRDAQDGIAQRVTHLLEAMVDLTAGKTEIVVVDDGSRDGTVEVLEDLRRVFPQVQIAAHPRPLGFEAAGRTGLERAEAELVFVCENDAPIRMEDLRRLWQLSRDQSVVAARAETAPQPLGGPLLRRLRAWGAAAAAEGRTERVEPAERTERVEPAERVERVTGLQMVRRPHLDYLASPAGSRAVLDAERLTSTAMASS